MMLYISLKSCLYQYILVCMQTVERNGVEGASFSAIQVELERWAETYVDVTQLGQQLDSLHLANTTLGLELAGLREANMVRNNLRIVLMELSLSLLFKSDVSAFSFFIQLNIRSLNEKKI